MFEIKMTEDQVFEGLKENFGIEFTAADVRAFLCHERYWLFNCY